MDATFVATPRAAPADTASAQALLKGLLETAPAQPWAAAARITPTGARCRSTPPWTTTKLIARPLTVAATALLAGGIVAASLGVMPVRAAVNAAPAVAPLTAPLATRALAVGALADLHVVPLTADQALLERLLAPAAAPRSAADNALLAALLASEPADTRAGAAPAPVSFVTTARLPDTALVYSAASQALPVITLADNIPPPPPPPAPVIGQAQPPPPPGYVQPPGYQDGVPFGGQIGAVPRPAARPAARPATRPGTAQPATVTRAVSPSYVVAAGDTLSAIALRFYGNAGFASAIYQANTRLIGADPNRIIAGQRLVLPVVTVQVPTQPAGVQPSRAPIGQRVFYTIQPRDYLRLLAVRAYGTERFWPEIYGANRNALGPNPDLIYPGVRIYIP